MQRLSFLLLAIVSFNILFAQNEIPKKIRLPENLPEVSGLYYQNADSLWWHNDSGDAARLILTNGRGAVQTEILLPAHNQDWEDIAADNKGNIYIGDFGNNANARKNLRIYIFRPETQAVDSILFSYPDQRQFPPEASAANFDMEGFFWHQDSLHLFSKNRLRVGNGFTKHYVLSAAPGIHEAILCDSIYLKNRVVTGAAISPDGQSMALLSYYYGKTLGFIPKSRTTLWLFSVNENNDFFTGKRSKQKICNGPAPSQFESIDFVDNEHVYVATERVPFYKQRAKLIKLKKRKNVIKP